MHARVVTVQLRPAKLSGAVLIYRELVLPLLQAQPGLCEARFFTDEHTGRGVLLTLWASEAAMRAVQARGVFHEEIARFQPVLGSPPSRECSEVSVSATGHGGGTAARRREGGKAAKAHRTP